MHDNYLSAKKRLEDLRQSALDAFIQEDASQFSKIRATAAHQAVYAVLKELDEDSLVEVERRATNAALDRALMEKPKADPIARIAAEEEAKAWALVAMCMRRYTVNGVQE